MGIVIPGPGPIPGFSIMRIPDLIPGTYFGGEYPSPSGAGEPGYPSDRVKFPSLIPINNKTDSF